MHSMWMIAPVTINKIKPRGDFRIYFIKYFNETAEFLQKYLVMTFTDIMSILLFRLLVILEYDHSELSWCMEFMKYFTSRFPRQ